MSTAGSGDEGPVIGLDIGATKVSAGVVDARGQVGERSGSLLRGRTTPEAVRAASFEAIDRVLEVPGTPRAIGIGVAAQVDSTLGTVWYAPNLGWKEVRLAPSFRERYGCPVTVANDARSAALGEWKFGAGAGATDLLSITVGTGVGGGVILGGRLLAGAIGASGEIGHTVLVSGGRRCHCPARGCLEAYVGGWAIADRAQEAVRKDPSAGRRIVELAGGVDPIDARVVGVAAAEGDRLAGRIVRTTSNYLAHGVAGLVNAFNPARVVLGGGVIEGWPHLVRAAAGCVAETCQPPAARAVRVSQAALGRDSVLVGAATLARTALGESSVGAPDEPRPRVRRGSDRAVPG
ncbi:MAG TPA: ROK family protein [Thermoplasmata archaeon]|nr:ROK family protein [Thermoplasmata archaeon]